MTSLISKLVFDRILKETRGNDQGRKDPYFENVPTNKMGTFSGKPKTKKRKKALPPGLSEKDQKTLVKVKRRAYSLDMALGSFCGMKMGWGSVIGFLPVIGDFADTLLALMVMRTAMEADLSSGVMIHMLFNIALDFVVGLVPFLGDLADMAYKANTRNALVLEDYLRQRGRENLRKSGLPQETDFSLEEVDYEEGTVTTGQQPIREPKPVYGGSSRGYTGSKREYDPESQRGDRSGDHKSGGHKSGGHKSKKGKEHGHSRLQSQETGTTAH